MYKAIKKLYKIVLSGVKVASKSSPKFLNVSNLGKFFQKDSDEKTRLDFLKYDDYTTYDTTQYTQYFFEETLATYERPYCGFQIGAQKSQLAKEEGYDFDRAVISQSRDNTWYYFESLNTLFSFDQDQRLNKIVQVFGDE